MNKELKRDFEKTLVNNGVTVKYDIPTVKTYMELRSEVFDVDSAFDYRVFDYLTDYFVKPDYVVEESDVPVEKRIDGRYLIRPKDLLGVLNV